MSRWSDAFSSLLSVTPGTPLTPDKPPEVAFSSLLEPVTPLTPLTPDNTPEAHPALGVTGVTGVANIKGGNAASFLPEPEPPKTRAAPDPENFAEWLKTHPGPDLQELIARFGGYNKITPEAWAEWDAANEAWQATRKARLTRRPPGQQENATTAVRIATPSGGSNGVFQRPSDWRAGPATGGEALGDVLCLSQVLREWGHAYGIDRTVTIDELVGVDHSGLKAALLAVAAMDDGLTVSNVRLARWLRDFNKVSLDRLSLQHEGINSKGSQLWKLRAADPAPAGSQLTCEIGEAGLSAQPKASKPGQAP